MGLRGIGTHRPENWSGLTNIFYRRVAAITKGELSLPAGGKSPAGNVGGRVFSKCAIVRDHHCPRGEKPYQGVVGHLDVDQTHNYIAENISVHNSICRVRGADFRNILNFERDFLTQKWYYWKKIIAPPSNILPRRKQYHQQKQSAQRKSVHAQGEGGGEDCAIWRV